MTKQQKQSNSSKKPIAFKEFLLALFLIVVLWAAKEFFGINLLPAPSTTIESEATGAIQVLFTVPQYPDEKANHYGGLDEKLAAAIDRAQSSVDIAAFELDAERITDALIRAHSRGVQVRLVTDSDYEDEAGPEALHKAKIPITFDGRSPFMHNKFVIIDGAEVWGGSMNYTENGVYRNNNNVVVIQSSKLAENYTAEFEEMFVDGQFGASSPDETPHPRLDLDGTLVENFFESEGQVRERMIELVREAEESVYFMAFSYTDDDISKAMIDRHRADVEVRGVFESRNARGTGSDFEALLKAKVTVLTDGNPYVMHHKVIIVDEAIVITGSYNFSKSAADRNDENVIIIHNRAIAAQYGAEFERVYKQAQEAE